MYEFFRTHKSTKESLIMKKGFVKGAAVMMAAMTMLTGCNSGKTPAD